MSFTLDEGFEWFLEKFGPVQAPVAAAPELIEQYSTKLPSRLLDYWSEYGFCGFKDGLLWLVNPDDYREAMNTWLKGTGVLNQDNFHVLARSGFGEMYLWGEKTGRHYNIDIVNGRIFDNGSDANKIEKTGANERIQAFFSVINDRTVNRKDIDTSKPIFEAAVSKFGPLGADEMFSFEPALFLGGEQTLARVQKVNFYVQADLLATKGQREILDIKGLATKAFGR